MRHHNGVHACIDCLFKRPQLHLAQARQVSSYSRHAQMRISVGVAVSGKMFCRGQHAMGAGPFDECCHLCAHHIRVLSKGARVNDGIVRIAVYIGHWKKIPMDSNGARFFSGDRAESFRICRIRCCAESHGIRKFRDGTDAGSKATLKISSDQKRQL
jgi:hypothetical protein